MSFNHQKFHHAENLSNSTLVSALNFRLSPFCRSLWEINDDWNNGNRSFKQVVLHLGIKQVNFELTPVIFALTEVLLNKNNFAGFDVELPQWTSNVIQFNEKPMTAFEFAEVQKNINKRIDLFLGKKQSVQEAIDAYNVPINFLITSHSLRHSKASMSREEHGWETAALFLSRSSMRRYRKRKQWSRKRQASVNWKLLFKTENPLMA